MVLASLRLVSKALGGSGRGGDVAHTSALKRELFTRFAFAAILFLAVSLQITFCKTA